MDIIFANIYFILENFGIRGKNLTLCRWCGFLKHSTQLEILFNVSPKHGKNLLQKVVSVRSWNCPPMFGSKFPHTTVKSIAVVETWWTLLPNIGRMFHHLMEATFWPSFYHVLVKRRAKLLTVYTLSSTPKLVQVHNFQILYSCKI